MQKEIIRRTICKEAISALQDVPPLLQRIYAARQVRSASELDRNLTSLIPFENLLGIQAAAKRLADAIVKQQHILIVGDFDADGATSTAVAIRALRSFGAEHLNFLVPNRFSYGYGLSPELVEVAKESAPHLIVTVDNGIANHAGVSAAKAAGIDVIITDHHLPAPTLPEADVIVNPNQPFDPFPSKHLAGVGVIFYVMLALRRELSNRGWFEKQHLPEPNMSRLLDLVALGTVADLVQLDSNNRILVHQGLRRIRAGQCIPGIVALLELAGRDFKQAAASDLGFAVASRLNAAGRLDDMALGITCLLTDDPAEARSLAKTLDSLNYERRHIEQDMQTQALGILNQLHGDLVDKLPHALCLFDSSWHQGVIGILAARIKDRFHRPVIVFAPGVNGELKGSARSIPGLHIRDTLARVDIQYPALIKKFGGHAMAAGLTIAAEDFVAFSKAFEEMVIHQAADIDFRHTLLTDGELEPCEINLAAAVMVKEGGPWGQAFPEPLFDGIFNIIDQRLVGDKHLKLKLGYGDKSLDGIAFFVDTTKWPNHRCQKLKAAYRLDVNEYKGFTNVQLILENLMGIV